MDFRGCTDIICALIFLLALVGYVVVSTVAFYYGDPRKLLNPQDSEGNTCGIDNSGKSPTGAGPGAYSGVKVLICHRWTRPEPATMNQGWNAIGRQYGRDMSSKPYLHMFDITKCTSISANVATTGEIACPTYSVCVEECPTSIWVGYVDIARYKAGESVDYSKYICQYEVTAGDPIKNPKTLIQSNNGKDGLCGSYYFDEEPLLKRCIPSILMKLVDTSVSAYKWVSNNGSQDVTVDVGPLSSSDAVEAVTGEVMKVIGQVMSAYYKAQGFGMQVLDDLIDAYVMLIIFLVISCVVIFVCIMLMRFIASVMIWTLLIAAHVAVLAGCYYCYVKYVELKSSKDTQSDPNNYNIEANLDYYTSLYQTWFYMGIALAGIFGIILLLSCFLFNRIRLAIQVLEEASQAVRSMIFSLFFPVVPWILQLIVISYFLILTTFVASYEGDASYKTGSNGSNSDTAGTSCTPQVTSDTVTDADTGDTQQVATTGDCYFQQYLGRDKLIYIHAYDVFMTLWLINFISAVGQCTLAGGFASWFWTRGSPGQFPLTWALYRCFRFHLGSLAFGSFIIALIQFIRIVLEYLDRKLKDKQNLLTKFIFCCLKCFFWCFEKFMKFINRNAYIMIAIYGRNFCFSAMDAFFLLIRNIARVAILNGITAFLLFTCKLALTAGMGFFAFMFFSGEIKKVDDWVPDLNYYFIPIIIVIVVTFVIATIFFEVYEMAIDTIFLCALEDMERHDGSAEKPYHMSKNLQGILGKKNDYKE